MKQVHFEHLHKKALFFVCRKPSLTSSPDAGSQREKPGTRGFSATPLASILVCFRKACILLLLLTGWLTSKSQRVLIIYDDPAGNTLVLKNALQSAGFTVTLSNVPEYQWNGTNPSLANFDCVVHLNGSTYGSPMPVAGQTALVNFVNAGKGYIGSEWLAYEISQHTTMRDLILADRVSGSEGSMTYTQTGIVHPVLNGIPNSFTFTGGRNIGPAHPFASNPVTVLMTDNAASAAVMVRQVGAGKVVNFNHAANYIAATYNTLGFTTIQNLYKNAVSWVTNPAPVISSFTPQTGIGAGSVITITGTGFTGATAVSFGGTAAASFTVVNVNTITAVLGAGATGTVSVTTPGGVATLGGFTYCAPVTPEVSIVASPAGPVCPQTPVTFTAIPVNGGAPPVYQWKKNGVDVGTNSNEYTENSPANGDVFTCTLTSNLSCLTVATVTSAPYTMVVNATSSSELAVSVCSASLPYIWNGIPFSTTGTYTLPFTNAAGCDSAATLQLTVNTSPTAGITNNSGSLQLTCALTAISVTATGGASYAWDGGATPAAASNSFSAPGTYTVTVTGANGCTAQSQISITQDITAPTAGITNNTGSALLTCALTAVNVTATGGVSYAWDGGATPATAANSFTAPGTYTVTVTGANGCTDTESIVITQNLNIPGTPAPVQGLTNVCPYIGTPVELTYSVPQDPNATAYQWIVPPTVTIVSGQGTNSINVTIGAGFIANANKQVKVRASSSCGTSAYRLLYLLAQLPNTPGPITASSTNVCEVLGSGTISYSVVPVVGATSYIWTAPNGATVQTGQGTNSVTVAFPANFSTGNITVRSVNDCGTSAARSITVTRNNPSTPSLISGPTNACPYLSPNGTAATYSVPAVANVTTYTWSVPPGAIGLTGQGTNTISFTYPPGFTSGTVSVTATNGCGTSGVRTLSIGTLNPSTPGIIDVVNTVSCPGRIFTYSLGTLPSNATAVQWTVPTGQGAVLVSGQGTATITVSYPSTAIDGVVTVQAINNCASSVVRSTTVKLAACAPEFTKGLPVAKGNTATAEVMNVNVYPNPTTTDFKLQVLTAGKEEISVRVLDMTGRFIKQVTVMPYQTINIGAELKAGSYMIETRQGSAVKTTRVIKF